ncbi:MAG: heavy-metal-associated domain-containing protein [Nitrospirota bacterium]|nr:MAG: heavy-metal-associated domain-containing protein [Nitrospirota bacterium]
MVTTGTFTVKGMTCDNCVRHVQQALQTVAGVSSASVSLDNQQATLEYDPAIATVESMTAAVSEAGYTMEEKTG